LLVFDALIYSKENVKIRGFRCQKKLAVFQSSHSRVARCLAIVVRKGVPESLVDAFIDQNAHLGTREQKLLSFFERGDRQLTRDGRKSLQKIFQCFPALQAVEKRLHRHSRSTKPRSSAKNFRVFDNNSHQRIVARKAF
jgi:hypothetical protein